MQPRSNKRQKELARAEKRREKGVIVASRPPLNCLIRTSWIFQSTILLVILPPAHQKRPGLNTELSMMLSQLLGAMVSIGHSQAPMWSPQGIGEAIP